MNDLTKFLDVWEKTGDIEAVLASGLGLPRAEEIRSYIVSLPEDQRDKIWQSLDLALQALASHTGTLEEEAGVLKDRINQNIHSSKVALAYNNSQRTRREK